MARGEGARDDAWPEEEPPLSGCCKAVRGSKSRAGAAREGGDRGEEGGRTAKGEREVSGSTVMAGLKEEVASGA